MSNVFVRPMNYPPAKADGFSAPSKIKMSIESSNELIPDTFVLPIEFGMV